MSTKYIVRPSGLQPIPFEQEKNFAIFDKPVISKGAIEISRPQAAVRWEFTGRSLLILKKDRVRRWGAEGKEERSGQNDPSLASMSAQMRALLTGDFAALKDVFTVTPAADGSPVLTLVPSTPELKRYIERLELRFRDDLSAPQTLLLVASGDDRTTYRFGEPQTGVELAEKRFEGP